MARDNSIKCAICKVELLDKDGEGKFAEIRRGFFHTSDTNEGDNDSVFCDSLKFNTFLCVDCFLKDRELNRFMNKIDCRIR